MFIWTNKRSLVAAVLCLPLVAACVPTEATSVAPAGKQVRVQPVLGGAVKVAAPAGYCVEPSAVLERADSAIVLIGRCTGGPGQPRAPAILTVAVGETNSGIGVSGSGPALAAFFRSPPGREALSRSGRAKSVTVLEAIGAGEAFLIRWADASPSQDKAAQAESWRAVLSLGGRLVTLTVTGTAADPLDRDTGRALLDRFVAAMKAGNR